MDISCISYKVTFSLLCPESLPLKRLKFQNFEFEKSVSAVTRPMHALLFKAPAYVDLYVLFDGA